MRIRTIKPEFWSSEDIARHAANTQLLAAALLNYSDDEGFFRANPLLIKASLFPLTEFMSLDAVKKSIADLSTCDAPYLALAKGTDGREYGRITTFSDHQVINKPTPSKIKNKWPTGKGGLPEQDGSGPGRKGREQGKEQGKESDFSGVLQAWNTLAEDNGLARVQKITKTRADNYKQRCNEIGSSEGFWLILGREIPALGAFAKGSKGWTITFDWIIESEENLMKLSEGAYRKKTPDTGAKETKTNCFNRVLNEILLAYSRAEDKDGFKATLWDKYKDTPKIKGVHVVSHAKKLIKEGKF